MNKLLLILTFIISFIAGRKAGNGQRYNDAEQGITEV